MWRSWSIRIWSLATIFAINCAVIAGVATLLGLSLRNNGFLAVGEQQDSTAGTGQPSLWHQGLLWTTFPSVLFTLYRIYFDSVATALVDEIPFAELYSSTGSSVKKSLMLDYRTYPSPYAWVIAFSNGHFVPASSMLLKWILTLYIIPFSSHLLAPKDTNNAQEVSASLTTAFDASFINTSVNYQTILDTVSAARNRGGELPSWTDGVFAFPTVDLSGVSTSADVVSLGIDTEAYSAYVDCRALTDYSVTRLDADDDTATITFSAVDRGCDITVKGGVGGSSNTYLKTMSKTNCPDDAGYSRLAMFVGTYNKDAQYLLSDQNFISCIPFYRKTPGFLNITSAISSAPALSFTPDANGTRDFRFDTWVSFEQDMLNVQQINSASPDFTSSLGEVILAYSRDHLLPNADPTAWIKAGNLVASTSVVFSTAFAVLATTVALQPSSRPTNALATLMTSETRLHVVPWIACSFLVIFAILILQIIFTVVHVHEHPTFLQEEPKGLLSGAEIVTNSPELQKFVRDAQADPDYKGNICDLVLRKYDVERWKCWVTRQEGDRNMIVLGAPESIQVKGKKGSA